MSCFPRALILLAIFVCIFCPAISWVSEMENGNLYEGDIILNPLERTAIESGTNVYGSIVGKRWPKSGSHVIVPFDYDENIRTSKSAIGGIQIAIQDYHKHTCIRFKRRTNEKHYILLVLSAGCASSVGYQSRSPQKVHLGIGCWNPGTVVHELGHAMGLWHEMNRPDRDSYIKIRWNKVQEAMKFNFKIKGNHEVDSLGTKYDYRSIMHYRETAFGSGSVTIETIDPYYQKVIGKGNGLSKIDIKQLNLMYECPVYTGNYPTREQTNKCYDSDNHCFSRVATKGCKDRYTRSRCRYTCNLCIPEGHHGTISPPTYPDFTMPRTIPPITEPDLNPDCPFKDVWANCKEVKSFCTDGGHWGQRMRKNCRKTCNFCGPTNSPPTTKRFVTKAASTLRTRTTKAPKKTTKSASFTENPSCRDTIGNCNELKVYCTNQSWISVLRTRCARTCKFC